MSKTYCPECDGLIRLDDPQVGVWFWCPQCNAELEITGTDPLSVYYPLDDEWVDDERWGDDWRQHASGSGLVYTG